MTRNKRIAAFIIIFIVCIPLIMVFNDDESKFYINALGLGYGYLLYKFGRRFAPQFVLDYLDEEIEEEEWD